MGTIIFTTDAAPGKILHDHICGEGSLIRMFTASHDSATIALSVDLTAISADWKAHILRTYDLPDNAKRAIVGVVVVHSGLNGRGSRSVSIKVIGEEMGPYDTGAASKQLLSILSPLRPGVCKYAADWRARAWAATDARMTA
jgi:hypothetical protein